MSRIRRFILLAVVGVAAATALALCAWQLERRSERRLANQVLLANRDLPPTDLTATAPGDSLASGRRVTVRGHFLPQGEMLLRGRAQQERPGLHVVTPFQVAGSSTTIWVLRGFVRSPDAASRPDDLPRPVDGEVTLAGVLYPIPDTDDAGQPLPRHGDTTWRRMDRATLLTRVADARPEYLHLVADSVADQPGRLTPVPLPTLDDGPHLSYAIQWVGIAIAILLFGYLMIWRRQPPQRSDL